MRRTPSTFVLSVALLLTGCTVGPDYRRPDTKAPAAFNGTPAVRARTAAASADLASWWKGFDDPLLTALVIRAAQGNLDIAQAAARVTQARASLRFANAALLPSGEIMADAARARQSLETPEGRLLDAVPGYGRNGGEYDASVGASWEIDIFGGLRRDQEAARAEYEASEAGVLAARLAVTAETADTYVTIRGIQSRLAIANEQVATQKHLVATVRLQFEKGIAAELQFHQAEGALSEVEATVPVLEAGLESAFNALDVLLADQPGTNRPLLEAPRPIPAAPAIADAGGPTELLRRRPDLIVAERRLAASSARIGSAISEYYPKFSLSGLVGTATTSASGFLGGGANQAEGMFGLRWRLFDFGRVDAEIASARGRNAEALAAYRLSVLRASEDVEDALTDLVKREAQEGALGRGETALAAARRQSFAAYKGGVVSLIEVLDADSRLLQTRDTRAVAQMEAAHAAVASFRALGGGWNANTAG